MNTISNVYHFVKNIGVEDNLVDIQHELSVGSIMFCNALSLLEIIFSLPALPFFYKNIVNETTTIETIDSHEEGGAIHYNGEKGPVVSPTFYLMGNLLPHVLWFLCFYLNHKKKHYYAAISTFLGCFFCPLFWVYLLGKDTNSQCFLFIIGVLPVITATTNGNKVNRNIFSWLLVLVTLLMLVYIEANQITPKVILDDSQIKSARFFSVMAFMLAIYLCFTIIWIQQQVNINKISKATNSHKSYVSTVSHEIRTPLNAILMSLDLLEKTELGKEEKQWTRAIRIGGENLMHIINNALELSKIEASKIDLDTHDFLLYELMEESVASVSANACDKRVLVYFDYGEPIFLCTQLRGDFRRLKQILVNLLNNSIRSTFEGEIKIGVGIEEDSQKEVRLGFQVIDTGEGISDVPREYLLNSILKKDDVDSFVKSLSKTGQGLYICKTFISLMGGELCFKSSKNNGSNFFFTIDLVKSKIGKDCKNLLKDKKVIVFSNSEGLADSVLKILKCWGMTGICETINYEKLILQTNTLDSYDLVIFFSLEDLDSKKRLSLRQLIKTNLVVCDVFDDSFHENPDPYIITYPLKLAEFLKAIQLALNGSEERSEKRKISVLIVEDNNINSEVFKRVLGNLGCEVDSCGTGNDAVEMASKKNYSIIFMDVNIPGMDGKTATKVIRGLKLPKQPLIVATTGESSKQLMIECKEVGMDHFLTKPINHLSLRKILETVD